MNKLFQIKAEVRKEVLESLRSEKLEIKILIGELKDRFEKLKIVELLFLQTKTKRVVKQNGEDPSIRKLAKGTRYLVCKEILQETGNSLRTPEIDKLLLDRGIGVELEKASRQACIHTAMNRHPEIFEKIGKGLWGLCDWDKEKE